MKGKQHKLDVNHNGHLDAEDFKMLRSGKKGKKHRKDEDKFIERVVGMLMDRVDELKQSTYQSAADKASASEKKHAAAVDALDDIRSSDSSKAANQMAAFRNLRGEQARRFRARASGQTVPPITTQGTRDHLRKYSEKYGGKGR